MNIALKSSNKIFNFAAFSLESLYPFIYRNYLVHWEFKTIDQESRLSVNFSIFFDEIVIIFPVLKLLKPVTNIKIKGKTLYRDKKIFHEGHIRIGFSNGKRLKCTYKEQLNFFGS